MLYYVIVAPYVIVSVATNKYEVYHKFIRNLKIFDVKSYINAFKSLPFITVYSFWWYWWLDKYTPLVTTKITIPLTPWMKKTEINNLQRKGVN